MHSSAHLTQPKPSPNALGIFLGSNTQAHMHTYTNACTNKWTKLGSTQTTSHIHRAARRWIVPMNSVRWIVPNTKNEHAFKTHANRNRRSRTSQPSPLRGFGPPNQPRREETKRALPTQGSLHNSNRQRRRALKLKSEPNWSLNPTASEKSAKNWTQTC